MYSAEMVNLSIPYDVIVSYEHKLIATEMYQSKRPVFGHMFSCIFDTTLDILFPEKVSDAKMYPPEHIKSDRLHTEKMVYEFFKKQFYNKNHIGF